MLLAGGTSKNCRYKKCGKPFKSMKVSHVFCRRVCRTNHNSAIFYARHLKRSPEIYSVRCKGCRGAFDVSARDDPPRKYCSASCKTRRWQRDNPGKVRPRFAKVSRLCRMCPTSMTLTNRTKGRKRIYCSTKCRNAGNRQDRKERDCGPVPKVSTGYGRGPGTLRVQRDDQPHRAVP